MAFALDSPQWSLLKATADRIFSRVAEGSAAAIPREEEVFYLVWMADGAVGNGGMHSVCYNSTGDYLWQFPEAFRAIGAPSKADAFERLIRAFGESGPSRDQSARYRQHSELSRLAVADIDAIDDVYFQAPENIEALLYKWCEPWATRRLGT